MDKLDLIILCSIAVISFAMYWIFSNINKLWIELKSMQNSTHKIQFIRAGEDKFQEFNDDLKKQFSKEFFDNVN